MAGPAETEPGTTAGRVQSFPDLWHCRYAGPRSRTCETERKEEGLDKGRSELQGVLEKPPQTRKRIPGWDDPSGSLSWGRRAGLPLSFSQPLDDSRKMA